MNPLPPLTRARPLRVLCVDDNPDIADTEALLLALVGFEARACYGGRDALALAVSFRPRVCLLDVAMPGMDGRELAAGLRHLAGRNSLILVAVTACTLAAAPGGSVGFDLVLRKPVAPDQLVAAVAGTVSPRPYGITGPIGRGPVAGPRRAGLRFVE